MQVRLLLCLLFEEMINFDEDSHSVVADLVLETIVSFDCYCRREYLQVPNLSSSLEILQHELLKVMLQEQLLVLA